MTFVLIALARTFAPRVRPLARSIVVHRVTRFTLGSVSESAEEQRREGFIGGDKEKERAQLSNVVRDPGQREQAVRA